nr:hypothetical protein [Stenotrophomonas maltophilia]
MLRDEIANIIANELAAGRIVPIYPRSAEDRTITRRYCLRRIRWLSESYGLAWIIDQATLGHGLDTLEDEELTSLLAEMEAGRRCRVEGVGFDDAGLVREARG